MGAGLPSISAGENSICLTASTAASSKPLPAGVVTATDVTSPSASMSMVSVTSPDSPAASASGGYTGSTLLRTAGGFVTLGARAGSVGSGGGGSGWSNWPDATPGKT